MEISAANLTSLFTGFDVVFQRGFEKPPSYYEQITSVVRSASRQTTYPWLGRTTTFREWLGDRVIQALETHDLVCVHVEAPDEASHEGRADAKVRALEEIDRHVVAPLLNALAKYGDWRILISPDHRTTLRTRAHVYGAVPFAAAGTGVMSRGQQTYDEVVAAASELEFAKGHELMGWFL